MSIGITRIPSNQERYDVYWSGDTAIVQAPTRPTTDDPVALAAWNVANDEHERKLQVARETGDWSGLLIAGESPVKFVLRQIPGHVKRKLQDRYAVMGMAELTALVFRVALVDVVGLVLKLEFEHHDDYGKLATNEIPDYLDQHAPGCIAEIAAEVFRRMKGLSGK